MLLWREDPWVLGVECWVLLTGSYCTWDACFVPVARRSSLARIRLHLLYSSGRLPYGRPRMMPDITAHVPPAAARRRPKTGGSSGGVHQRVPRPWWLRKKKKLPVFRNLSLMAGMLLRPDKHRPKDEKSQLAVRFHPRVRCGGYVDMRFVAGGRVHHAFWSAVSLTFSGSVPVEPFMGSRTSLQYVPGEPRLRAKAPSDRLAGIRSGRMIIISTGSIPRESWKNGDGKKNRPNHHALTHSPTRPRCR
jgi:hypothetical protein